MRSASFGERTLGSMRDRVAVLLCAEISRLGEGLDVPEILRWFRERDPAVCVHTLPDLCQNPEGLAKILVKEGATRVVLGLCGRRYEEGEVQVQVRKAGIDPLGLEVVDLGGLCARAYPRPEATEKAKILLAGSVASARAFPGSSPANVKPYLLSRLSRRSFLRFPPLGYRAVPSVERERCVTEVGCALCVQACPYNALEVVDGEVKLEKSRCTSCGLCMTACPLEAILFPGYTPGQVEARVRAMLDPNTGNLQPRGILFTCSHGQETAGSWHPGWMPLFLPSLAMAPPVWFLAPLLMGARAVGVLPCPGDCPQGHEEIIQGRVRFCQELLERVGAPAGLVQILPPLDRPPGGDGEPPREWGPWGDLDGSAFSPGPATMARILLRILEVSPPEKSVVLEHPFSPLGIVEIQEDICTGCGMCGRTCPSRALVFEETEGQALLHFDPSLCTACGQCLPVCPEGERGAIRLRRGFDQKRLQEGKAVVYREAVARCVACGAPIAPNRMLERVMALLGSEDPSLQTVLTRYCTSCRSFQRAP
ncbi:MAG: 4Fe-4S binding protein [Armatimonadota bacterium]|nr:4Fe-4S binding protein [Armatimonadota bacterium]MDR5702507.1 4Fe-4S binding protein [Armatimonadota bacterium]